MANVGVGFSQDLVASGLLFMGTLRSEIARLAVMGVLGDVPGDPLLFMGTPGYP